MRFHVFLLAVLAAFAAADQIEIGTDEFQSNKPFCGDCSESMRYQVLYTEEEMGDAIEISALYLKAHPASGTSVTLDTLLVCIGQYDSEDLGTTFADNYIPGTMDTVLWQENCTLTSPGPNEWFEVPLDNGYWYDGDDGLVLEIAWPAGEDAIYNWNWTTTAMRQLLAGWNVPTGTLGMDVPHILLEGTLAFDSATFGSVKAEAAR